MIEDLEKLTIADWSLGRHTADNQATLPKEALLVARNVIRQSGAIKPIPGYTKVQTLPLDMVERLYSFERQSDQKQLLVGTGKSKIALGSIDGSTVPTLLDKTQTSGDFDFVENAYALYMTNGVKQNKIINIAGVDTLTPWGLNPATTPPAIVIGGVGLTLQFGTRYVYCEVFQWTDDVGTLRYHIGVPSEMSAHTGPLANKAVTLVDMIAVNPFTTHFWIFRVQDSVFGASGTFFFVAQIPSSQSTYVDNVADIDLDTTRSAPFDNFPPPDNASIALEYKGRVVLLAGDTVYLSALDEISLGVQFESFPVFLQFVIPGGVKNLSAGIVFQQQLLLSTSDFWFQISGSDINTFQMLDRVVQPGAIGRKLVIIVHGQMIWLGKDKKLWKWNGVIGVDPYPMSQALHGATVDQLNMDSLSTDLLSKCELQWYSDGTIDLIVLVASSDFNRAGEKDWLQVWDLSPTSGIVTIQGPIPQPAETDFFPLDSFSTALVARSDGQPFMFFGSQIDGSVFRWPDGVTFNGLSIQDAVIGSPWLALAPSKAKLKLLKLLTNTENAKDKFAAMFRASKGVNPRLAPVDVALEDDVQGNLIDTTVARANLATQEGTSFGNWVKVFVKFPDIPDDFALSAIEIDYEELPGV
jgi:hypothetical protein